MPAAGAGGGRRPRCSATARCWPGSSARAARGPPARRRRRRSPSADDRAYYVSRAASLLASPSWESRNLGVKLLGLLQARDKLPLVLALLSDRRPAPWYKRLLGGDFEQVGFIRRNALTTIARLGTVTPEVEAGAGRGAVRSVLRGAGRSLPRDHARSTAT